MTLQDVAEFGPKVGPYLSGIGLILAASAAWTTYVFYYKRTNDVVWLDTFRKLYEEYWKSDEMARVRKIFLPMEEFINQSTINNKTND